MRNLFILALIGLCFSGLVQADTAAYQAKQLAKYERYAGTPVDEFPMIELYQWQVVGPQNLVVWPLINKAYLLTVDKPCTRLQWTHSLGISREMTWKVTKKFDYIMFGHQQCYITKIQPIDYKLLRHDDLKAAANKSKN